MFLFILMVLCQCSKLTKQNNKMRFKVEPIVAAAAINSSSSLLDSIGLTDSLKDFISLILKPISVPSKYLLEKAEGHDKLHDKLFELIKENDITKITNILNNKRKRKHINLNKKIKLQDKAYTYFMHMIVDKLGGDTVSLFIENKSKIDEEDSKGNTPLIIATEKGDTKAIELLLKAGANSNKRRRDGLAPIHIAVLENHIDSVDVLTKYGLGIKLLSSSKLLPIHYACLTGNVNIAELILSKVKIEKKDTKLNIIHHINESDEKGRTPLHFAVSSGQIDIIQFVHKKGGKYVTDYYKSTPLHYACISIPALKKHFMKNNLPIQLIDFPNKNISVIDELFRCYKNKPREQNSENSYCLSIEEEASKVELATSAEGEEGEEKSEILKVKHMLLAKDAANFTPFHYASLSGDVDAMKALFSSLKNEKIEIDITENDWKSKQFQNNDISEASPLDLACYYNNVEILKYLIDKIIKEKRELLYINENNNSLLHYASMKGNYFPIIEILKLLDNDTTKIRYFLNRKNSENKTATNIAEERGYKNITKLFYNIKNKISQQNNEETQNEYGENYPLHNKIKTGEYELVDQYLNENVYIYLKTDSGVTAMHIVSELGYHDILECIYKKEIEKGKNILSFSDNNENNEAHYAAENNSNECMKIIAEYIPQSLDVKNKEGDTPLHIAIQKENEVQVDILIKKNVNVNSQNNILISPLILASKIQNKEKRDKIIRILVNVENINLDIQDTNGITAIEYLYNMDDYINIECLLIKGASLNIRDNNKLTLPMKIINDSNNEKSSTSLILNSSNLNIKQKFPNGHLLLYRAIYNQNNICVKYLLEREDISQIIMKKVVKTNKRKKSKTLYKYLKNKFFSRDGIMVGNSLDLAMKKDENANIVKLFLEHGININKREWISRNTLLHKAMKEGKFEITKELLKSKEGRKNLQKWNSCFSTPLGNSKLSSLNLMKIAIELGEVDLAKKAFKLTKSKSIFIKNNILNKKIKNEELLNPANVMIIAIELEKADLARKACELAKSKSTFIKDNILNKEVEDKELMKLLKDPANLMIIAIELGEVNLAKKAYQLDKESTHIKDNILNKKIKNEELLNPANVMIIAIELEKADLARKACELAKSKSTFIKDNICNEEYGLNFEEFMALLSYESIIKINEKSMKLLKDPANLIIIAIELGEVNLARKAYKLAKDDFILTDSIREKANKSESKELKEFLLKKYP